MRVLFDFFINIARWACLGPNRSRGFVLSAIEKAEIVLFHLKHQPVTSDSSFIVGFDDK